MTPQEKIQASEQAFDEMVKDKNAFGDQYGKEHPKYVSSNSKLDKIFDVIQLAKDQEKEIGHLRKAIKVALLSMESDILKNGVQPEQLTEEQKDKLQTIYFELLMESKQ